METVSFRLQDLHPVMSYYDRATADADTFVNALGQLDLRFEGSSLSPRNLWTDRSIASQVRMLMHDMPALPVLLAQESDAALWVPMSLACSGITINRQKATAEIDLPMFDLMIKRMAVSLAPLVKRLDLTPQQLIEVNGQLREFRHHLIVDVQR
jgi:hypothetical protein